MTTETRNDAADQIQELLADEWVGPSGWIDPDYETLVTRALADERRVTVERIRAALPISGKWGLADIYRILDEELGR